MQTKTSAHSDLVSGRGKIQHSADRASTGKLTNVRRQTAPGPKTFGVIQRNRDYVEKKGSNEMYINDSQQGLITATTENKNSSLEYYVVGVQNTIAGEWVIHEIHSNLNGHGGAMMYHLCLLAEKKGIKKFHATTVAQEAYDRYGKWGFKPDPKGIAEWKKIGITDPRQIRVADWYADVATVKGITMSSLYKYWVHAPDNAAHLSAAKQILASIPVQPPPMPQVQTLDDIIANGGKL